MFHLKVTLFHHKSALLEFQLYSDGIVYIEAIFTLILH